MRKLALTALLMSNLLPSTAQAGEVAFYTENLRPYNYIENGQLTGISVELLRLVWEEMGEPQQGIKVETWETAYYLLQNRPNIALFLTMRSPNREGQFQWACPIVTSRVTLIALRSRHLKVNDLTESSSLHFGAMKASVGEQMLIFKGIDVGQITTTDDFEKALRLLKRKRVDVVVTEPEVVQKTADALGYDLSAFEQVYELGSLEGCFAFSRHTDPKYVARFQTALDAITSTPRYGQLLTKYHLEHRH